MPVDYMLRVMRDPSVNTKRRDAMATAAAPYLHPKLSAVDAKLSNAPEAPRGVSSIEISFVHPQPQCIDEDEEGKA